MVGRSHESVSAAPRTESSRLRAGCALAIGRYLAGAVLVGLVLIGRTPRASADSQPDAAADAKPPYDAGDGLTPLASLPTWGEGEDHDGCSCRSAEGAGRAAAAAPWMIAAFAWIRSRRSRGAT